MKLKMIVKLATDIIMTVALLLLMTYELIGQAVHEWIGAAVFVLFILHHILNSHWCRGLLKGNYTAARVLQTVLVVLVLLSIPGSMFSGVILSRHVFSFISVRGWRSFARNLHMLSAYWGFVFMALHLGFHWNMIMGMAKKLAKHESAFRIWMLRIIAALTAGYGIDAFIRREIGSYMLLKNQFVFFDFEEPLIFFIMDYLAVMGLFVFLGHYVAEWMRCRSRRRRAA